MLFFSTSICPSASGVRNPSGNAQPLAREHLLGPRALPAVPRTVTDAISCGNAPLVPPPLGGVRPPPGRPRSRPGHKTQPKVCFLLLIYLPLFQWNCAVTKCKYNTFQMTILYPHGVFSLQDLSAA